MKNTFYALVAALGMLSWSSCKKNNVPDLEDPGRRAEIISELTSNETYMKELMDSMFSKHDQRRYKHDHRAHSMMDRMMEQCKADSSMFRKMMSKTMDMCEGDQNCCAMMADMMTDSKSPMQCMAGKMKDKGMMDQNCMDQCMEKMNGAAKPGAKRAPAMDHTKHH